MRSHRKARFPEATRAQLESKFIAAWLQKRPDSFIAGVKEEAEYFINLLEGSVELPGSGQAPAEQGRQKRLEAFVNATDKFIDALSGADDVGLGHVLFGGLLEIERQYEQKDAGPILQALVGLIEATLSSSNSLVTIATRKTREANREAMGLSPETPLNENQIKLDLQFLSYEIQSKHIESLKAFSLGMRKSLKNSPRLDKDDYSLELRLARVIEDNLSRMGLDVTTSDTGLAGCAFIATIELSGRPVPRPGYWLKKAKEHPDSYSSLIERTRASK